jgi:hypothetical protein
MEPDPVQPAPAPRPRPFPTSGKPPGPRCGHTLTAISGPEGEFSSAKLVMFGEQEPVTVASKARSLAETYPFTVFQVVS